MQAALKEAEKVHKNQNASKEEIEKAYTDLETAMENLDAMQQLRIRNSSRK